VKNKIAVLRANSTYLLRSCLIFSSRSFALSWSFLILLASSLVFYNLFIKSSSSRIFSGFDFLKSSKISSSFSSNFFSFCAFVSISLLRSASNSYFSIETASDNIWSFSPDSVIAKFIKQILTHVSGE